MRLFIFEGKYLFQFSPRGPSVMGLNVGVTLFFGGYGLMKENALLKKRNLGHQPENVQRMTTTKMGKGEKENVT